MCYQGTFSISATEMREFNIVVHRPQDYDGLLVFVNLNNRRALHLLMAKIRQLENSMKLLFEQEGVEHECEGINVRTMDSRDDAPTDNSGMGFLPDEIQSESGTGSG